MMSCKDLCTGDEVGIYIYCLGVRSVLMHTRSHNNASGQCRDIRKISKLRTYSPQFGSLEKFNRILVPVVGFCPSKLSLPYCARVTACKGREGCQGASSK